MSRKYHWHYSDAASRQTGTMICTVCRARITRGAYRYRETPDAHLSQHRACSQGDPQWAALDAQRAKDVSRMREKLAAFKRLRQQWGAEELDDAIADMESALNADADDEDDEDEMPCSFCFRRGCNGECSGDGLMGG